jgi:hypothetical protein
MINLADAKVSYEGQNLPAINLIGKLQMQLQEAAYRLAAIAETLGDLQAVLLDSNTVEVKLTLSRVDFARFKSLGGTDDSERIRKAVMALIHPEEAEGSLHPIAPQLATAPAEAGIIVPPTVECPPKEQSVVAEPTMTKKLNTTCLICQSPIALPERFNNQFSVEIKCDNCGTKYLMKSKRD